MVRSSTRVLRGRRNQPSAPDPKQMRAWRAVRAFRRLIPQLNSYVRAMTGDPKMRVEETAGTTGTDGKKIMIRPPARLGDELSHIRSLCNKRSKITQRQMCNACDVDEVVMASISHELAHIVFGTMEKPNEQGIAVIENLIDEWHPKGACTHAEAIRQQRDSMIKEAGIDNYMLRCNTFHEVLGILLNSFEDARVNTSMFTYRPGTRTMMDAHSRVLFGVDENEDDEDWVQWKDRDINAQVLIGMFLYASEDFDYLNNLDERATKIVGSEDLEDLVLSVSRMSDIHQVVEVTVAIFRMLQDKGALVIPKCVLPEKEEDSEDDNVPRQDSEDEGTPGQAESSPSGADQSSGSGTDAGPDQGEAGSGGDVPPVEGAERGGSGSERLDNEPPGEEQSPADDSPPASGGEDEAESGEGDREDLPAEDGAGDGEGDQEHGHLGGNNPDSTDAGDDDATTGAYPGGGDNGGGLRTERDPGVPSDEEEGEVPDGLGEEGVVDEEALDSLRATVAVMTLHDLIRKEVPDANTEDFACGQSHLHPHTEEGDCAGGEVGEAGEAGWGDADKDGNVLPLLIAIMQSGWFETPSVEVAWVEEIEFPNIHVGWFQNRMYPELSDPNTYTPSIGITGKVTTEARLAFEANKRSRMQGELKSGKVNTRVLGRRAPLMDPRLFKKKLIPAKRDYAVVISGDCSGSTEGRAKGWEGDGPGLLNSRIKRAIFGQAEALHWVGVKFEIWMHTAEGVMVGDEYKSSVLMLKVKGQNEPWDNAAKMRLASVEPFGGNLDGHTLEYIRKRVESYSVTDRVLIYYTDGAMPAMNAREEGEILLRETEYCRKNNIQLLAVGIETDSPTRWGFDTVRVDTDVDLIKVMEQLKRTLT